MITESAHCIAIVINDFDRSRIRSTDQRKEQTHAQREVGEEREKGVEKVRANRQSAKNRRMVKAKKKEI